MKIYCASSTWTARGFKDGSTRVNIKCKPFVLEDDVQHSPQLNWLRPSWLPWVRRAWWDADKNRTRWGLTWLNVESVFHWNRSELRAQTEPVKILCVWELFGDGVSLAWGQVARRSHAVKVAEIRSTCFYIYCYCCFVLQANVPDACPLDVIDYIASFVLLFYLL